jgi:hypothetical protein
VLVLKALTPWGCGGEVDRLGRLRARELAESGTGDVGDSVVGDGIFSGGVLATVAALAPLAKRR